MASPLILDACCVLNLAATGRRREILSHWDGPLWVPDIVTREAIKMQGQLISYEHLEVLKLELDELDLFVEFAQDLDDGEAAVLALALARKGTPATDDIKALRIWKSRSADPILGTAELMFDWAKDKPPSEVAAAILDIEKKARFTLGRRHPLFRWWDGARKP